MYQFDDPTAVATRPAATAAGTAGWFQDGNPALGTPASIMRSEFMNMVMAEMLGVLAAGGVTPSKSASNQLALAINTMIGATSGGGGYMTAAAVAAIYLTQANAALNYPTKTGGGASGNWAINANTATTANTANTATTATNATHAVTADTATTATTATYATNAGNASWAATAGNATLAASCNTASFANNGARAWVEFYPANGAIRRSLNVTSVTRNSVGNYTINFNYPLADTNYGTLSNASSSAGSFGFTGSGPISTNQAFMGCSTAGVFTDFAYASFGLIY
jgi:hypothetical protein